MKLADYRPRRRDTGDTVSPWVDGFPVVIVEQTATRLRLTLPEPPSANRWWRMYRGKMVKSPMARDYQERVQGFLSGRKLFAKWTRTALFPTQPLAVTLVWYRGKKAGDLDKRVGVLLDALQETVYAKDSQIVRLSAERLDGFLPKMDVTVEIAA